LKKFINENGGAHPTPEEMSKIESVEHALIYKEASVTLKNRLRELEKLKLTKT
jgi:hypothetical protein